MPGGDSRYRRSEGPVPGSTWLRQAFWAQRNACRLQDLHQPTWVPKFCSKSSGDQASGGFMMFDTSFSYTVFREHEYLCDDLKRKSFVKKFNMVFAFCHIIIKYGVWLDDHEDEELLISMIKYLAKRWKALLKKTDAELGIDTKYTRPGILVFLDTFKKRMEDADSYGDEKIAFNFQ